MESTLERLNKIDETTLVEEDRLGLAWCRLNYGGWDPLLGPEPAPEKRQTYSFLGMSAIESIIGTAQANWYAWRFLELGTRKAWLRWWLTKDFQKTSQQRHEAAPIKVAKVALHLLRKK